jgi:hypothetical protein
VLLCVDAGDCDAEQQQRMAGPEEGHCGGDGEGFSVGWEKLLMRGDLQCAAASAEALSKQPLFPTTFLNISKCRKI